MVLCVAPGLHGQSAPLQGRAGKDLQAQLPGYALSLIDPRLQRLLDPRKPAPTGRTPLKSYLVHFYRTDRLSSLPPVSQVPTLEELGDDL